MDVVIWIVGIFVHGTAADKMKAEIFQSHSTYLSIAFPEMFMLLNVAGYLSYEIFCLLLQLLHTNIPRLLDSQAVIAQPTITPSIRG